MNNNDELDKRIKAFENNTQGGNKNRIPNSKPLGGLLSYGIDLFAYVCIGVFLGVILDKYFSSKPVFLLICLIISIISVFRTIILDKKF